MDISISKNIFNQFKDTNKDGDIKQQSAETSSTEAADRSVEQSSAQLENDSSPQPMFLGRKVLSSAPKQAQPTTKKGTFLGREYSIDSSSVPAEPVKLKRRFLGREF